MPPKETIAIPGSRIHGGTESTRTKSFTIGTFITSRTKFAMSSAAISPHTTSGRSLNRSGPGVMLSVSSNARSTAVVPEPGTPRVSIGTSAPPAAALLPASGAATPRGLPVPKVAAVTRDGLLRHVGEEAAERGAGPRQQAGDEADGGRAQHRERAPHDVSHREW